MIARRIPATDVQTALPFDKQQAVQRAAAELLDGPHKLLTPEICDGALADAHRRGLSFRLWRELVRLRALQPWLLERVQTGELDVWDAIEQNALHGLGGMIGHLAEKHPEWIGPLGEWCAEYVQYHGQTYFHV